MNFRELLKTKNIILDGGMGTILQEKGLQPGEHPELWSISHKDIVSDIHRMYFDAGSNVVNTNTFGANILKFDEDALSDIIRNAVDAAKKAREASIGEQAKYISLDIGPTGKLLKPFGDLDFEDAVSVFKKTVEIGVNCGVDLITIETMNDSYETKAALLAVREITDLPVLVTNAYGEDGKLMTGATPEAMSALLEGMGADAIGANCSLGPLQLKDIARRLLDCSSVPVIIKPNAGIPKIENEKTVFDVGAEEFSEAISKMVEIGVRIVGGCCGTTPKYIRAVQSKISALPCVPVKDKELTRVSSYSHALVFGDAPVLIGERINPTGKKSFKEALIRHDIDYILNEGIRQQEKGVHILDVNVGLPEICEKELLCEAVCELQSVLDLPLQIDTSDYSAMELAMRQYNGKPMVNSVNGKEESMTRIFPLVKKYGGVVVALTLDENGIPSDIEGRIKIAKKILERAAAYGIAKKDIIFDTLALTVSSESSAALSTLGALSHIRNVIGCHTSLGVSNISFGLPERDTINSTFFTIALAKGLSAAIMNPYSTDMMKAYYSYLALTNKDESCKKYIDFVTSIPKYKTEVLSSTPSSSSSVDFSLSSELQEAIVHGRKDKVTAVTRELLSKISGLEIVTSEIIPALDIVGKGYEAKIVYLPQLLMSAEAAKQSFEIIRDSSKNCSVAKTRSTVVIATVKGDIHDIGKNIVKLLLDNYGFNVIDLGKDVPPERIVDAIEENGAKLCGLSALMTTTVPSMEETIRLIHQKQPFCKVMVGGAVLTKEYADKIGADKYAHDAMDAVRYAEELEDKKYF